MHIKIYVGPISDNYGVLKSSITLDFLEFWHMSYTSFRQFSDDCRSYRFPNFSFCNCISCHCYARLAHHLPLPACLMCSHDSAFSTCLQSLSTQSSFLKIDGCILRDFNIVERVRLNFHLEVNFFYTSKMVKRCHRESQYKHYSNCAM